MADMITGIFNDATDAQRAIDRLLATGIPAEDISVLTSETTADSAFAVETGSKVGEGAAIGGGAGGAVGAVTAGLTAVGAIATGGAGLVAAGPVIAAFAGAGAGATAGGIAGALVGLGIPEHEAKFVDGRIEAGGVLVGVRDDGNRRDPVEDVFEACDVERISSA